MKKLLILFLAGFIATAGASPTPDFTEVNKATKDLVTMLETLQKEVPLVDDAQGTAKALDYFTKATNDLVTAMKNFAERFPEATKGAEVPKEFAASNEALMQTKNSPVPKLILPLVQRFKSSPDVKAAAARLWAASERFQEALKQTNK